MTREKIFQVIKKYKEVISRTGCEPIQNSGCSLCHAAYMCEVVLDNKDNPNFEIGKSNRWLGFIQAILYVKGIYTIDHLKNHNKPNEN